MAPHKHSAVRSSPKKHKSEEAQADHELFLQAFKKPTQIYRFLRTRNLIAPVFLHRSLTYLKKRCTRDNKRRKEFVVNDILQKVKEEYKVHEHERLLGDRLVLKFAGFFHNHVPSMLKGKPASVEVSLLKVCHKRRKDTSPNHQTLLGRCLVQINPAELSTDPHSTISINGKLLDRTNGHTVNSYVLYIKIHCPVLKNSEASVTEKLCNVLSDDPSTDEMPHKKKRRTSRLYDSDNTVYTSELVVLDKHGRCQLTAGTYELVFQEVKTKANGTKNATWETIMDGRTVRPLEVFNNGPILKFHSAWQMESNGIDSTAVQNGNLCNHSNQCPSLHEDDDDDPAEIKLKEAVVEKLGQDLKRVSERKKHRVFYQFLYNNNTKQQTEAREDMHCPWCSLNCIDLYGLLKHLTLCHSRFNFTYIPCERNARIDVTLNEHFDGSYAGNPQNLTSHTGYAFSRNGPCRRTPVTQVLVMKYQRQPPSLNEFLDNEDRDLVGNRPFVSGHNRVYHHTHTLQPLTPQEMDIDSEDEIDPSWLKERSNMMIDEFTDVNEGEKELTKLWNVHVLKNNFIADSLIPGACRSFVKEFGNELIQRNLKHNFLLHMVNLFDFSLIQPSLITSVMSDLEKLRIVDKETSTEKQPGCSSTETNNHEHDEPSTSTSGV